LKDLLCSSTRTSKSESAESGLRFAAEKFAAGAKVWATIQKATSGPDAFASAQRNPEALFAAQGAKLPKSLMLEVFT
jgi:hypothetical protein